VALFDSGEAAGFLFYVMPCIEGESLRARLDREKRLDVEAMLAVARPVAQALAYAHDRGVVHRDIKPENILLSGGQPFVTDFGIARAVSAAGAERLTRTGIGIGTPAYMSPEQAFGEPTVDARSDIYSLGCVIYEMLSGAPPFTGSTVEALLARRLMGPPPHLANVPTPVDEVVRKSLAPQPQDRFATAIALADALVEAARKPATQEKSMVVLPFENLSPDPDQEYFADGLTEELISDLSAVTALRVISRSSAMTFKGSGKRAPAIAGELNVRYVLEGSVRRAGNSLRITAQLIDAKTDTHLWSGKYPGTLEDVFDIQEKVSTAIVEALKLTLTPQEQERMAERPIADVRAYEWHLKAVEAVASCTAAGVERAMGYLEAALNVTGPNAALYAGVAMAHWQKANLGLAQEEAIEAAEKHVSMALALSPDCAEALSVRGAIEMAFRGNVQASVRTLKQALRQRPEDAMTLMGLTTAYAQYVGATDAAEPIAERMVRSDPLSELTLLMKFLTRFYAADYGGAVREWERAHELARANPAFRLFAGLALASIGRADDARAVLDPSLLASSEDFFSRVSRMAATALAGDRTWVAAELTPGFRETTLRDAAWAFHTAQLLAMVRMEAEALDWLDVAVTRGFMNWAFIEQDPLLANVRGSDRFARILARAREARERFEI
ncbi:MAG: hypothetical protein FIA95_02425, partial [Gemmatimonadetes bacterium]|nr:hypothetical protein [Gemmatimonadota bacterium]